MRSDAEIRRQVERRVRRWGLLALNAILWVGAAKLIYVISERYSFSGKAEDVGILFMVGWAALVGLHALRTFYVEGREWLVRRAIAQEHQRYGLPEKRKRDDSASLPDETWFSLPADDGEYTVVPFRDDPVGELGDDFPFRNEAELKAKR
ncbi:MAG: hypothetical protein GC204_02550 [Chloroflexi bacterium]|nr:hypothetical protein [Chloroflexota bacterium]